MNHNLHKVSFIFAISIVCFVLPINTDAKIKHLDYHLEYVSKVALETGNIWKRNLIDPLSKIWQPWFNPGSTEIYTRGSTNKKITEITEEAGTEKNVGEVLSVSVAQGTAAPSQVTTQEVLAWLKDLFLLQQTSNYSGSSYTQAASPVVNNYYSSGVTQGLADSVGRSVRDINTNIGGDLDTLEANGVFNTSVLSVDTVNTRVGIGTSSPTDTLSINGPVYLAQVSAPSNTSNRLYNVAGDLYWAGSLVGGASTGNWATDGTHVWRASGSVGIGTTTPGAKLQVSDTTQSILSNSGSFMLTNSSDPTLRLNMGIDTSLGTYGSAFIYGVKAGTDYLPLLLQPTNGKVGIGTTSPFAKLSVESTAGQAQFVVGSSTATQFIVDRNGNVGVGTANPGFLLHVNGNSMIGATVPTYIPSAPLNLVNSAGGNMKTQLTLVNTGGGNGAGSAIDFFTYDLNGGTSPGLRIAAYDNNYSADFTIFTKVPGNEGNALTERLRVTNAGLVGIGTSTPWRTLSVNGTAAMPGLVNDSTGYYVCLNTTTGQMATSTTACGASSERFKENIQDITYGLNEVLGLRPVSFDYKADYIPNAPKQLGFIAEEVDLLVPELVARNDSGEIQGLDYPKFTALLVRAVQEVSAKLDTLVSQMQTALAWFTSDGKFKVQNDICVDDVCVTKDQFKQILLDSAVGATQYMNTPEVPVETQSETQTQEDNTASSTPEIIPNTPEENASTTPNIVPNTSEDTPSKTASTTPGTE